jgi:site-specific DNA recombinase
MKRADDMALKQLGLSDEERTEFGLDVPAAGGPDVLVDVYIRRSKKREDLTTLRAHLRDIARWTEAQGLGIRHVWFEQLSASKSCVFRDEFERARAAVLDGHSKTLAVWKTDRLDRRGMGAGGALLDELDRRRARLVSVHEGLDSRRGGRIVFALLSERARDEAKDISERVQVGLDAHRAQGRAPGGRPPFGVTRAEEGRVAPDPDEYPLARRIAEALLRGEPTTALAHQLTAEGARTRTGRHWSANAICRMVHSPLWAGFVPHRERLTDEFGSPIDKWAWRAEPLIGPDGSPVSCGAGVVSPAEWYVIKGKLAERTTKAFGTKHGHRQAQHLLTGILRCGICQVPVVSGGSSAPGKGSYRCRTYVEGGAAACPGARTRSAAAEEVVASRWIEHVSGLDPGDAVLHEIARRWLSYQDPEIDERLRRVTAAQAEAHRRLGDLEEAYYMRGVMQKERFEHLARGLREQLTSMEEEVAQLHRGADLTPLLDGVLLEDAWHGANFGDRRMLLRCALRYVTLVPAKGQGDRTPIVERLQFEWVRGE